MHISLRSAAASTVVALLIAQTTLTATASTPGTQFAFLDQVKEFFVSRRDVTPSSSVVNAASSKRFADVLFAPLADQFFACDGSALSTSTWANTNAGPFTSPFVSGNTANFALVGCTATGGTITVGGINITESVTTWTPGGTIGGVAGTINPITIASGKSVDFGSQAWSSGATVGFSLNGGGAMRSQGGTFAGGFVMNSGTLVAGGVNAMGAGNTLTINGGTIAANSTRDFTGKYPNGIIVGGNFQLGELSTVVPLSSSTANLTFSNNMNLGAATRTITIGGSLPANYTLGGVISGNPGTGLTITKTAGANARITLTNANTYTGDTTVNGGLVILTLSGSIANSANIVLGGGGTLDVSTLTTALTLANGQGLVGIGNGTTGIIAGAAGKGLTTSATTPITFAAYNGSTPPLRVGSAGDLTLQTTNPVSVTTTTQLGIGSYKLISKATTGNVVNTPTNLTVSGSGICGMCAATLGITNGELFLNVASTQPNIDVNPSTPANFGSTPVGTPTAAQTSAITGTNLTADVVCTVTGVDPSDFQVSSNGTTWGSSATFTQSGGNASGTLSIRFNPQSYGSKNAAASCASAGAATTQRNIFGAASDNIPPVITYTPLPATATATNPTLTVTATDAVGVTGVTLIADIGDGNGYQSNACTGPVTGTAQNGTWSCTIAGALINPSIVKYYVTATDGSNIAVNPTNGAGEPNAFTIGAAAVPAGTYSSLSLGDGSSIAGHVTVNRVLTLGGVVTTGANSLEIGCNGSVSGAGASNYVSGSVKKDFCGAAAFTFPVGANGYAPVAVNPTAVVNPSSLTVSTTNSRLFGTANPNSLNRYWTITETGDVTANLAFTYLEGDIGGNEANYHVIRSTGGPSTDLCPSGPCVNTTTDVLTTETAVSDFGFFTGAEANGPTGSEVSVSGRVVTANGNGIVGVVITVSGTGSGARLQTITSPFGYFKMDGLDAGDTYVVTVRSKRFVFANPNRVITLNDSIDNILFTAEPQQ